MPTKVGVSAGEGKGRRLFWLRAKIWLFHTFFVLRRPMTLGVRALIHDRERGTVFLIRHTYVPGWQLPGGGVETGETMEDALRREVLEEGGIEILGRPELRSVHYNRQASRRDHVALYLVTSFWQVAVKTADREIAEAGFFALDALPEGTTAGTRRRIAEVMEGVEISEEW